MARVFDGESMFGGVVCTSAPKPWRWGRVPRKEEKEVIPVVSCLVKIGVGTPERGKTSRSSGELPRQDWGRHPGKRKNKSLQW